MGQYRDRGDFFLYDTVVFKGKTMYDIANDFDWRKAHIDFQTTDDIFTAIVPAGMEHRPDLIANAVYGSPKLYWVVLVANNIYDPEEALDIGDKIRLPRL